MNLVARKLIAKELYVNRWFIGSGAFAAVVSIAVTTIGKMGFNVGALMWLTTIIALGVMLAIYGVMNERKEHTLQFVLSLPISTADYVRAKLIGLLLCYLVPWIVGSAAAVAVVLLTDMADGMLPYAVLLCVFMLMNFALILSAVLHATTESIVTASIVVTNMLVSIFMFTVASLPDIGSHMSDARPAWNDTFFTILILELCVLGIALALPFVFAARRRDFL
jgi:ABC-2 type transport system permease protein